MAQNNESLRHSLRATRQRNTFFCSFFSVRTPSRGDIRRQLSMARDKENERGKIGAEVNEMQRLERKKERKKKKYLVEIERLLV